MITNLIGEIVTLKFEDQNVYGEIVAILPYGTNNAFYIALSSGPHKGRIIQFMPEHFWKYDIKLSKFFIQHDEYADEFPTSSSSCLDEEDEEPPVPNEAIDHSQYNYE
jgi:hypothetical protein